MNISYQFLFLLLTAIWFISLTATTIHPDEKKALKDIANSLGKKDWNFDIDPCSNKPNWATPAVPHVSDNNVTCDCSVAGDNFCHVISIILIAQNLPGTLPPELTRLRYLQIISLLGNRLTGSIPVEIANISTLQTLELWINQMSGNLPPELGNLTQLQILRLSSNNFTGELPMTLAKLTNLQDFRIEGNQFSGKIPDYIQNWTSIQNLMIQGSGLSGPIPSGISLLNLTDLRISDLDGSEDAPLPQLNKMTSLQTLILRNCNISGKLHDYLGTMPLLKTL
ncbi:putative cysteine-rich RLK (receptor-like kinase) protein [Trifolium pratense]|uniref:Putative cysteine-rich RLK (Receptor-like kinase) protein n=1 Tax=Trifolium pratense TaxID=57577 RepID=A0A2K3MMH9_TRIPR|nr:putative cysteine-rich RLK (receptor-like kinase) protein [Trifolium pratense]